MEEHRDEWPLDPLETLLSELDVWDEVNARHSAAVAVVGEGDEDEVAVTSVWVFDIGERVAVLRQRREPEGDAYVAADRQDPQRRAAGLRGRPAGRFGTGD